MRQRNPVGKAFRPFCLCGFIYSGVLDSIYLVFPVGGKGQELFRERSNSGILAASELNVLVGATEHCVAGERYVLLLLALVLFSSLSTSS